MVLGPISEFLFLAPGGMTERLLPVCYLFVTRLLPVCYTFVDTCQPLVNHLSTFVHRLSYTCYLFVMRLSPMCQPTSRLLPVC